MALARRLAALAERPMREAALVEYLQETPAEQAAFELDEIRAHGTLGGPPYSVALLTLAGALNGGRLPYDLTAALYAAAKELDLGGLAQLFLTGVSGPKTRALGGGEDRELTLGHRKTMARGGDRDQIARLLRSPELQVIPHLLKNTRLTEADVVRLAARRPTDPAIQREILRSQRWAARYAVKRALVLNPYTPSELALRLLGFLVRADLALVRQTANLSETVRDAAEQLMSRRRPTQPVGQ
jgi:hypothetical protein